MNLGRSKERTSMEITVTYLHGNEVRTIRGTPAGDLGDAFVLRKDGGGTVQIYKRHVIMVEGDRDG